MIDNLMIFAAGRGTRMGHLTQEKPKSLLEIAGKPILHYSLELALTYNFKKIIINTHYFAEQIVASVREFEQQIPKGVAVPEIVIIHEPILLETGGAIKNAINVLGDKPIFTLASDVIISSKTNLFEHVLSAWKPEHMDFLLMLQETENSIGYVGQGDFDLDVDGRLLRKHAVSNLSPVASEGLSPRSFSDSHVADVASNRPPAKLASEEQVLGACDAENRSVHMVREDLSLGATTRLPSEVEFRRRSNDKSYCVHQASSRTKRSDPEKLLDCRASLAMTRLYTADSLRFDRKMSGEQLERTLVREDVRVPKSDDSNLKLPKVYDYMYTSLQILKPKLIAQNPAQIFPIRDYYFQNPAAYGVKSPKDCRWYHANTPEDIDLISTEFA